MSDPEQSRPTRRKYKGTRDLIRRALNDGYTQAELAKMLRVSQSMISRWSNGECLAKTHQLKPLLEQYGGVPSGRQRRHLYAIALEPDTSGAVPTGWPRFEWRAVVGEVIFRHTVKLRLPKKVGDSNIRYQSEPSERLIVHRNARGQLLLVVQRRLRLSGHLATAWLNRFSGTYTNPDRNTGYLVRADDPDALWHAELRGPLDPAQVIEAIEKHLLPPTTTVMRAKVDSEGEAEVNPETGENILVEEQRWGVDETSGVSDPMVVPYRLRRALLDAGYLLADVQTVEGFE